MKILRQMLEWLQAMERDLRKQLIETGNFKDAFRRIEESFSNVIQLSLSRTCPTDDPVKELDALARLYLEHQRSGAEREPSTKRNITNSIWAALEYEGIGDLVKEMPKAIEAKYGFKFDFGYGKDKTVKLFHAVPLKNSVVHAVRVLARYPQIADKLAQDMQIRSFLTAVVEDDLDRNTEEMRFMLKTFSAHSIQIAAVAEMPGLASIARIELLG